MRHAIQLLERRLLFVTITTVGAPSDLTPEIADFYGTRKNDVIVVTPTETGIAVTVNGVYTETTGGKLNVFANGGNDKVHIDLPDTHAGWHITIHGGAGDDVIIGSVTAERIIAGDGNDYVVANGGRDTVYGEGGDDSVRGGGSSDLLDGGDGRDTLRGDAGNDNISGGGEVDRLRGSLGNDTIRGGSSKDFIGGEAGNDDLYGEGGGDVLSGGENDDTLAGGQGDDHCAGDDGIDLLNGGSGVDHLFGGGGKDRWHTHDAFSERQDFDDEDRDPPGNFIGQTITGASTIAMYTYAGDMNFDGIIDSADYGVIDNWVQTSTSGDFNYDGTIDAADYGVIDASLGAQAPRP